MHIKTETEKKLPQLLFCILPTCFRIKTEGDDWSNGYDLLQKYKSMHAKFIFVSGPYCDKHTHPNRKEFITI